MKMNDSIVYTKITQPNLLFIISCEVFTPSEQTTIIGNFDSLIFFNVRV